MNEELITMLMPYLTSACITVLTAIASYVGLKIKSLYETHCNTVIKKQIVKDTCKYVEQIYKDLHGEDKLEKALEAASQMLEEKNIPVTDLELRVLIEAAVNSFKDSLNEM